ncbi:SDR family NAD(P)-dependent oxidoreductase, partial [Ilumatobacter sp.]|uniref:SDR family NAD(P)-dependent oxidoreductase n=1 Tax=Ilumatobacter sp. TaxID=1967498 RepID=UPI00374FFFDB
MNSPSTDLQGQTVIVTGAAGDIGSAVVESSLAQGAKVLAVDIDPDALEVLGKREIPDGAELVPFLADVSDESAVMRYCAEAVARWGVVDGFFNNAGIEGQVGSLESLSVAVFDQVMAVNVRGVFLGLKHVLPAMRKGGSIVNAASTAGHVGS